MPVLLFTALHDKFTSCCRYDHKAASFHPEDKYIGKNVLHFVTYYHIQRSHFVIPSSAFVPSQDLLMICTSGYFPETPE